MALGVLQPDIVGYTGVAPMIIYLADTDEVVTISGLGRWPRAADVSYFERNHGGELPLGVERCVTPASIDAWCQALRDYGTVSFAEAAEGAVILARDGFATHRLLATTVAKEKELYAHWPGSAVIMLPGGNVPVFGRPFLQTDLACTIERLMDAEARATGGRSAGLEAVRGEFYQGSIAREVLAFIEAEGGLMTAQDLANFSAGREDPVQISFGDWEIFSCGPWCQGPMLLEFIKLFEQVEGSLLDVNSASYVHSLTELMKLAFADREAYFGDPDFIDVPLDELLTKDYAACRISTVSPDCAASNLPLAGETRLGRPVMPWMNETSYRDQKSSMHIDTSYLCVVDKAGNGFSCTPSDGYSETPIIPGLGFAVSSRGSQSWVDNRHPNSIAPWKRPRMTPNPALAKKNGKLALLFGTPGGDVQCQVMFQTFLNIAVHGMDPQAAIETPRFSSESFPSSFHPHTYKPGVLRLERELRHLTNELTARGHKVIPWPQYSWRAGGVCVIQIQDGTGYRIAGADPRRECYALAW
jgi:gamma-glutamyltranspeptidase/glutathione hydrolase